MSENSIYFQEINIVILGLFRMIMGVVQKRCFKCFQNRSDKVYSPSGYGYVERIFPKALLVASVHTLGQGKNDNRAVLIFNCHTSENLV